MTEVTMIPVQTASVSGVDVEPDAPKQTVGQPALLPDPLDTMLMGDDVIAQITAMMSKAFREDRKTARSQARIEDQAHWSHAMEKVAALREQAESIGREAKWKGFTTIAGSALQGAGVAGGFADSGRSQAWLASGEVGNGFMRGAGELGGGAESAIQKELEADAALADAKAERAKRAADECRDEAADAKRMVDKVAEFLKEVRSGQAAAASAAVRG